VSKVWGTSLECQCAAAHELDSSVNFVCVVPATGLLEQVCAGADERVDCFVDEYALLKSII
jgi:hypothetical protein